MSERIKELVKGATRDTSGKWLSLEDAEQLVEFVVRECASLAYDGPSGILGDFGLVELADDKP